eukprot:TRINITY_DN1014_c0_g1_i1.p3 TRINITY_DN1014_c0_g1~~TRINITY_DN1014_c0_g1_i1.p3  ORF type:complete len:113 (-),score=7.62 TRINITY_DN1014_c0_g1_i1:25-363(-)
MWDICSCEGGNQCISSSKGAARVQNRTWHRCSRVVRRAYVQTGRCGGPKAQAASSQRSCVSLNPPRPLGFLPPSLYGEPDSKEANDLPWNFFELMAAILFKCTAYYKKLQYK